jgi:hypothetical protein
MHTLAAEGHDGDDMTEVTRPIFSGSLRICPLLINKSRVAEPAVLLQQSRTAGFSPDWVIGSVPIFQSINTLINNTGWSQGHINHVVYVSDMPLHGTLQNLAADTLVSSTDARAMMASQSASSAMSSLPSLPSLSSWRHAGLTRLVGLAATKPPPRT